MVWFVVLFLYINIVPYVVLIFVIQSFLLVFEEVQNILEKEN